MKRCKTVVFISLAVLLVALASQCLGATSEWATRPGTVGNALSSEVQDGASVYLDAVIVDKIQARKTPHYFTVRECYDAQSKIVVNIPAPAELRYGQTVDISGVIIRLPDGSRAIGNASVFAYLSKDGDILYHGPLIEGPWSPTPWPYMANLTAPVDTAPVSSLLDDPIPPGEPNTDSGSAPIYCETIAAAKAAYSTTDRILVELQCRSLENPTSNQFTLKEDDSSDVIPVYYTNASSLSATDRINKIVGTIQKDAGTNYWIEVNSGPNWQSQDVAGNVQAFSSGSIAWAKTFSDWTTMPTDGRTYALENKPVVWVDTSGTTFYIQEPDRSCGLLVSSGSLSPDTPGTVNINGSIATSDAGERVLYADGESTVSSNSPAVLGMPNKVLGGPALNIYTPGAGSIYGLSTLGMLIRTWGKVTAVSSSDGYFYIDDGSNLKDGTTDPTTSDENVGVRIMYSDTVYPQVGDYVIVTGACGKTTDWYTYNNILCVKTYGTSTVKMYPARIAPEGLAAVGCNGKVILQWLPMCADAYGIFRSTSQSGTYTKVGESSSADYTDTAVTNDTTYWYKVCAINGSVEGPQSGAVSAQTSSTAPVVAINSATIADDGMLTLQCTGSAVGGDPGYTLVVDGTPIWTFTQSDISNLGYDTTQLSNGSHKVELWAISGNAAAPLGVDSRTIDVQNYISNFYVPSYIDDQDPITATFPGTTNWTLTCTQGGTTLYTTSGTGTSMSVAWDAGSTWGDFDVTLTATPAGSGGMSIQSSSGQSKTVKGSKTQGSNPRRPYLWSSVYCDDTITLDRDTFNYTHQQAAQALQSKLGVTYAYQGILRYDSDWQNKVIDLSLDLAETPADIFCYAGHGIALANNPKNPAWQTGMIGHFPNSSYAQGSGLTAFVPLTQFLRGTGLVEAVGPAIGNTMQWDRTTGRYSNWQVNRRLKFVYISACESGKTILSQAFGIPTGRHKGLGRAFLGFKKTVPAGQAYTFATTFWREWKKSGVTVAQAAARAKASTKQKIEYVINGDPFLTIW